MIHATKVNVVDNAGHFGEEADAKKPSGSSDCCDCCCCCCCRCSSLGVFIRHRWSSSSPSRWCFLLCLRFLLVLCPFLSRSGRKKDNAISKMRLVTAFPSPLSPLGLLPSRSPSAKKLHLEGKKERLLLQSESKWGLKSVGVR